MTDKYLVVSADSLASPSLGRSLRPFCPPEYLEPFDAFATDLRSGAIARGERNDRITVGDQVLNATKQHSPLVNSCAGHDDSHARLRDMDAEGVAAELVFAGGQDDAALPFVGLGADSVPTRHF